MLRADSLIELYFAMRKTRRREGPRDEDRYAGAAHVGHFRVQRGHDRRARPRPVRASSSASSLSRDHAWLLVAGELPSAAQRRILDATLVAIAEHGLVPSVAASRMTLAAAPEALQGAVAAGILGCGSVILGSADAAARVCSPPILTRAATEPLEAAARAVLGEMRAARQAGAGLRPSAAQAAGSARHAPARRSPAEAGTAGRHIEVAGMRRAPGARDHRASRSR